MAITLPNHEPAPTLNGASTRWLEKLAKAWLILLVSSLELWSEGTIAVQQPPVQTHGQAVGDVTDSRALIWMRANRAARVAVEVALNSAFTHSWTTEPILVGAETDFTAKIELLDLEPSRRYYYRIILHDPEQPTLRSVGPTGTFVTAPAPEEAASFTFAWSGDSWARFKPFRIFRAIPQQQPDFFLYLGDTIYADLSAPPARTLEQYRQAYKVNRHDQALQTFLETTSVYVIWDDHEVQDNFDSTHPRIPVGRQALLEYWPIRTNEEDPTRLYRSFRWGRAVELFILDTRQYRSPSSLPDTSSKTMLGAQQKAWLKAALLNSTATFKVVATSVPLRFHGRDSWEGYTTERQELFDFIAQNNIKNLIFLSADVHYAAVINHPEGFTEVIVGPLAQIPSPQQPARSHPETAFTFNRDLNYGLVRVRADQQPASAEITILDKENRSLHTTVVVAQ